MSKTNEKNIIWNDGPNNINVGFMSIETPDNFIILRNKVTGKLVSVNKEVQKEKLYNAQPCYHTDINWEKAKWFEDCFYGHNNIMINGKVMNRHKNIGGDLYTGGFTLGAALKKINKIEHCFPEGSEIELINNWYYRDKNGSKSYTLKYKTSRKFQGFSNDIFQMNDPELFTNFTSDKLLADLISFLRLRGFIFFISDEEEPIYEKVGESYVKTGKNKRFQQALGYGHDLMIGISEFDNRYNGYYYGEKSILFDKRDYFDKWSKAIEITKPKDSSEFEKIYKTLTEFTYDY